MAIPESEIKFEGSIKKYEDRKTDSGKLLLRFFCDTCGRWVLIPSIRRRKWQR
jgi:hypothetical protein